MQTNCTYGISRIAAIYEFAGVAASNVQRIRIKQGDCNGASPTAPANNTFSSTCPAGRKLFADAYVDQNVVYASFNLPTYYPGTCITTGAYTNNICAPGGIGIPTPSCPSPYKNLTVLTAELAALDAILDTMSNANPEYDELMSQRRLVTQDMARQYNETGRPDDAADLLAAYGDHMGALALYASAGMWSDAYDAHGNLPTGTDEEKLYVWLSEKFLDLYSIDSTWDDLDSTSKDSLLHIEQMDSYAGGQARSISEELGLGSFAWYYPDFDSTVVLPDVEDTVEDEDMEERMANSINGQYTPGLENLQGTTAKFSLYPNPSIGNFILECTASGKVSILTLEGKLVGERDVEKGKNSIMLPKNLAGGMYMIRYNPDGGASQNKKLIYQP